MSQTYHHQGLILKSGLLLLSSLMLVTTTITEKSDTEKLVSKLSKSVQSLLNNVLLSVPRAPGMVLVPFLLPGVRVAVYQTETVYLGY